MRQHSTRNHLLFKALQQVEYGHLTLISPEGGQREFTGTSNGPAAHWKLFDHRVLSEIVARGELGFAESYIEMRWDSDDLVKLITFFLLNSAAFERYFHGKPLHSLRLLLSYWLSLNSLRGSRRNIKRHYDLGNDFYSLWLDRSMTYSCALFEGEPGRSLEDAQHAKYQRILNKLQAKPGDHILDIGCGWGGFTEVAAQRGSRVTAITLSKEQADYACERLRRQGLDKLVVVQLNDYREIKGTYDHIVSIGMFEHVGRRYWPSYFRTLRKLLAPGGKAMVQSITLDDDLFESLGNTTGFIEKYIFPGGFLPSKRRFCEAVAEAGLTLHELYPFGQDYARTLACWSERFKTQLEKVKAMGYDEQFIRMWHFYLASCIAAFASSRTDVMQVEITHKSNSAMSVPSCG
jgi:cyclopropane-fatty-acyl-phospholipid synthase